MPSLQENDFLGLATSKVFSALTGPMLLKTSFYIRTNAGIQTTVAT